MTTYLVRLTGRNFLINSDEGPRKKRFHATRLVEAENPNRAEMLARDLIRNDSRLRGSVRNDVSDQPVIDLESIREVPAMAFDAQSRAHAFYWEDKDPER